jgi:hypothetical protein
MPPTCAEACHVTVATDAVPQMSHERRIGLITACHGHQALRTDADINVRAIDSDNVVN